MKYLALMFAALPLTACDAAMEQVDGQVRTMAVEQCRQASDTLGVAPELVAPVCECASDELLKDGASQIAQIDQQRVRDIVRACLSAQGSPQAEPAPELPEQG